MKVPRIQSTVLLAWALMATVWAQPGVVIISTPSVEVSAEDQQVAYQAYQDFINEEGTFTPEELQPLQAMLDLALEFQQTLDALPDAAQQGILTVAEKPSREALKEAIAAVMQALNEATFGFFARSEIVLGGGNGPGGARRRLWRYSCR